MNSIGSITQIVLESQAGTLVEYAYDNLEMKSKWTREYGKKLSALANKNMQHPSWMVVGIDDDGVLLQKDERWAKKQEEVISQQINTYLDPFQTCVSVRCERTSSGWLVVISLENPGDVVYWNHKAYRSSGTTIAELSPEEILRLRIRLPGLTDYSRQDAVSAYDRSLLQLFENRMSEGGDKQGEALGTAEFLKRLEIHDKQTARILFGDCAYRVVVYDAGGSPRMNEKRVGLYGLLTDSCIEEVKKWATGMDASGNLEVYPEKALREALSNAVAHAAYFEKDGDIVVEIFSDRVVISNLCSKEQKYFANRWFSRNRLTVNSLLMEVLRVTRHVDELGRGKRLIFSESIKAGRHIPEVDVEQVGRYSRWKLTLYGGEKDQNRIRLLQRTTEAYENEQKALIAFALVLWRGMPVQEMRQYVDGDFARQFAEVLLSFEGPVMYDQQRDQIILKRWAAVLLGMGQDSKEFSRSEEDGLKELTYNFCRKYQHGELTPSILRRLGQMGDTKSEQTLSSRMLDKWMKEGLLRRVKRGQYDFLHEPPAETPEQQTIVDLIGEE